jgi:deoxyribodipyrimidine photo-lyase
MNHELGIVWLRRDLRLEDNVALARAGAESKQVALLFVFDPEILEKLESKSDLRVTFIYESLVELDQQLKKIGSRLLVRYGNPETEVPLVIKTLNATALYFNEDYEDYAKIRDQKVTSSLEKNGIECFQSKDHVIFSGTEICKSDGSNYRMFTPYKNAWLKSLRPSHFQSHSFTHDKALAATEMKAHSPLPTLEALGFRRAEVVLTPHPPSPQPGRPSALKSLKAWSEKIDSYHLARDFPCLEDGTSGLSTHLRFGTLSIRECVRLAIKKSSAGSKVWLSELIWRDFYQMILDRFPHVTRGSFKPEYDKIKWLGDSAHFKAWCQGRTGVPIVDAGMRQLNQTGWMHNRVRMITASFLVKDLLIDWKKGEAYFAEKLLDYDFASNNGGWQWCASTGCDAQPYFRIFNPMLQSQKFDADCHYIKQWVPELRSLTPREIHRLSSDSPRRDASHSRMRKHYPFPIVSHAIQKMLAIKMFQQVLDKKTPNKDEQKTKKDANKRKKRKMV